MNENLEHTRSPNNQQVDIKEVFRKKNPKLAHLIPNFVFQYLRKIIHEDEINDFLRRHGQKYGIPFVNAAIEEFNVSQKLIGKENIPQNGHYIFVSNHPLGGFDGLLLMSMLHNYFNEIRFLVNDILMNIDNLTPLFIPINKHGSQNRETIKAIDNAFRSDIQILTFPAGLVSRRINKKIVDLEWQKNFIIKAKQHKRDIVPVHMSGRVSNFFYNLANLRRSLGIKSNIEMLYLVDETYKHKNEQITVHFGKPISYQMLDRSKTPHEWAQYIKQLVYNLPNELQNDL